MCPGAQCVPRIEIVSTQNQSSRRNPAERFLQPERTAVFKPTLPQPTPFCSLCGATTCHAPAPLAAPRFGTPSVASHGATANYSPVGHPTSPCHAQSHDALPLRVERPEGPGRTTGGLVSCCSGCSTQRLYACRVCIGLVAQNHQRKESSVLPTLVRVPAA